MSASMYLHTERAEIVIIQQTVEEFIQKYKKTVRIRQLPVVLKLGRTCANY